MKKVAISRSATSDLLLQYGFQTQESFFGFLERKSPEQFQLAGLDIKPRFIYSMRQLIHYIEVDSAMLSEARKMTESGSIFEGLRSSYFYMNSSYRAKRKKMREMLTVIKQMQ